MSVIKYLSSLLSARRIKNLLFRENGKVITSQHISAVFVGCARNAEPHLAKVLSNIERFAQLYGRCAFVFVENDSGDKTKSILKHWLDGRSNGHLLEFDGLVKEIPSRTARLAYTRNAYMEFVRRDKYKNYQHLVIVDFDDVNATDIDANEFESALRFLESAPEVHGVFTNSLPVYYDIWALRHQEWCPTDCWAEQRECQDLPKDQATERYVYSRQLFIPSDTPPIPVQSAFGGLAIYRLSSALKGIYNGISKDGSEVCEHVSFNIDISKGGKLYIYPKLHNYAPLEHLSPSMLSLGDSRELMLEQNGRECRLIAPDKHLLDKYRQNHPLYDRRLPLLTQLMSQATPDKCMIDVGANIGDTIALCRLGGCELDIVAVEPSQQYFSYLELNRRSLPELFNRVHPVRAFIGTPGDHMILVEDRGTASVKVICDDSAHNDVSPAVQTQSFDMVTKMPVSIIKTDTDGYDASIIASNIQFIRDQLPVLWVETDTTGSENENQWRQILSDLSPTHPFVCIFDNFGFLVAYGKLSEKQETIINLIGYARRHKANRKDEVGEPRIYYLDLALFPDQYINVYNEFVAALQESH